VVENVYSAVRTDSLYKADYIWPLNNRGGNCLQCGTDCFPHIKQITFGLKGLDFNRYSSSYSSSFLESDFFVPFSSVPRCGTAF